MDKHGVEFANTRTRGKPNCGKFLCKTIHVTYFKGTLQVVSPLKYVLVSFMNDGSVINELLF